MKIKMPNGWRAIKIVSTWYTIFDFTVDEGKEWLNPSREKNSGKHRRKKVDGKSCVTFFLCTSIEVQNEREENTHTHTDRTLIFSSAG